MHKLQVGDKALRLSTHRDEWTEFTVNETYLPLIKENPRDYKRIGASLTERVDLLRARAACKNEGIDPTPENVGSKVIDTWIKRGLSHE